VLTRKASNLAGGISLANGESHRQGWSMLVMLVVNGCNEIRFTHKSCSSVLPPAGRVQRGASRETKLCREFGRRVIHRLSLMESGVCYLLLETHYGEEI
jgi:hypothetical protein